MKGDGFFIRNGVLQLRRLFLVVFLVEIGIFIAISSLSIHNQVLLSAFKNEQQSIVTQLYEILWFVLNFLYIFIPVNAAVQPY